MRVRCALPSSAPIVCGWELPPPEHRVPPDPAHPLDPALVRKTVIIGLGRVAPGPTSGYPNWQGYYVYWLVPNSTGTSYDLMRAWQGASLGIGPGGVPTGVTAASAGTALTTALAISPPPVLTNYITSMSLGDASSSSTINFELMAGTTGGADQTQTTFQGGTYARN